MKLIKKVSTVALGSLTTFGSVAIISYCIQKNKEQKSTKIPLTAYQDCVQNSKTIPKEKRVDVCVWLYRKQIK